MSSVHALQLEPSIKSDINIKDHWFPFTLAKHEEEKTRIPETNLQRCHRFLMMNIVTDRMTVSHQNIELLLIFCTFCDIRLVTWGTDHSCCILGIWVQYLKIGVFCWNYTIWVGLHFNGVLSVLSGSQVHSIACKNSQIIWRHWMMRSW